jgi:hypothetical protein
MTEDSTIKELVERLLRADLDAIKEAASALLALQKERDEARAALARMADNVSALRFNSGYPYDTRTLADAVKVIKTTLNLAALSAPQTPEGGESRMTSDEAAALNEIAKHGYPQTPEGGER